MCAGEGTLSSTKHLTQGRLLSTCLSTFSVLRPTPSDSETLITIAGNPTPTPLLPQHSSPPQGPSHPLPYFPRHSNHTCTHLNPSTLCTFCEWSRTVCGRLCLASFTQHGSLKVHAVISCVILIKCCGLIIFQCTNILQLCSSIHLLMDTWAVTTFGDCK